MRVQDGKSKGENTENLSIMLLNLYTMSICYKALIHCCNVAMLQCCKAVWTWKRYRLKTWTQIKQHSKSTFRIRILWRCFSCIHKLKTMYVYMNAKMYTSICVYEYLCIGMHYLRKMLCLYQSCQTCWCIPSRLANPFACQGGV